MIECNDILIKPIANYWIPGSWRFTEFEWYQKTELHHKLYSQKALVQISLLYDC